MFPWPSKGQITEPSHVDWSICMIDSSTWCLLLSNRASACALVGQWEAKRRQRSQLMDVQRFYSTDLLLQHWGVIRVSCGCLGSWKGGAVWFASWVCMSAIVQPIYSANIHCLRSIEDWLTRLCGQSGGMAFMCCLALWFHAWWAYYLCMSWGTFGIFSEHFFCAWREGLWISLHGIDSVQICLNQVNPFTTPQHENLLIAISTLLTLSKEFPTLKCIVARFDRLLYEYWEQHQELPERDMSFMTVEVWLETIRLQFKDRIWRRNGTSFRTGGDVHSTADSGAFQVQKDLNAFRKRDADLNDSGNHTK